MHLPIKRLLSALVLVIPVSGFGQTASPQAIKAQLVQIAGQHCSQAKYILQSGDAEEIASYMEGKKTTPINLINFETAVHEVLHGLDDKIGVGDWVDGHSPNGFFIEQGIEINVPFQKTFHTADMHRDYFPAEVKRLYRYNTYIFDVEKANGPKPQTTVSSFRPLVAGESETTANVQGIYGLLEEQNAYYHGALAEYEIIASGIDYHYPGDVHMVTSAYYEFNIFMAYFLQYAKEQKPEVYKALMANKPLRTAYTLIEVNWRDLLTKIYQDEKIAAKYPGSEGEQELYSAELQAVMNSFMIPEAQLPKYASFFKSKTYRPDLIAANRKGSLLDGGDTDLGIDDLDDFDNIELNGRDIGPKETGYFYVVVEVQESGVKALETYMRVVPNNPRAHIFTEGGKYHVYLDRFSNKTQADSMASRQRGTYPSVKVL